jgi:hypothetical protein
LLREKRKQWLEALSGRDQHSVVNQLSQMAWDAATYRVINEARRFAKPVDRKDPQGRVQLSGLMHGLIERGFFTCQMVAIRRLTDTYPLEGRKSVYSLTGLINDIRANCGMLTRYSILDAENIEPDRAKIEEKRRKFFEQKRSNGETAYGIPFDCSFTPHDLRQGHLDFLTGIDSSRRQSGDGVRREIFDELEKKFTEPCKAVVEYVNKFIAHAATPTDRVNGFEQEAGLTLGRLWDAQKHLCEVTGFLSIYVLGGPQLSFLPVAGYDQFQFIERPLIRREHVPDLRTIWTEFGEECRTWGRWKPN